MSELSRWSSFYDVVGSAAGALIGLQFVVITLLATRPPPRAATQGGAAAFSTPNIVHFSAVLLIAVLVHVPWGSIVPFAVLAGLTGTAGFVYAFVTARRMRAQSAYEPDMEDWLFYALLPLASFLVLTLAAVALEPFEHAALFALGTVTLLLLFGAIHNAWDAASYHVLFARQNQDK